MKKSTELLWNSVWNNSFRNFRSVSIPLKYKELIQLTDVPDLSLVLTVVSACVHWHFNIPQQFLHIQHRTAGYFPTGSRLIAHKKPQPTDKTKQNKPKTNPQNKKTNPLHQNKKKTLTKSTSAVHLFCPAFPSRAGWSQHLCWVESTGVITNK